MKNIIILVLLVFLTSCGNNENPKVIYAENEMDKNPALKKDSTLVAIADLPIHIDGTDYLIHPIGEYEMYRPRSGYFSSSSYDSGSFSVSQYNGFEI